MHTVGEGICGAVAASIASLVLPVPGGPTQRQDSPLGQQVFDLAQLFGATDEIVEGQWDR